MVSESTLVDVGTVSCSMLALTVALRSDADPALSPRFRMTGHMRNRLLVRGPLAHTTAKKGSIGG